jgi:hypothetical protein
MGSSVIPALTPQGFAQWEALQILSYPEEEWQRLQRVVRDISIFADDSVVDGKPESLPRQVSRYLFPRTCDPLSRKLLNKAIIEFLDDLGSLTQRGAKPDQFNPLSSASIAADLVQRHLRDQQMLKPHEYRSDSDSVYSRSSFASYGRDDSHSSSSMINSRASSIFSVRLDRRYRSTTTIFPDAPPHYLLTCLLDTCTASCPDDCSTFSHSHPFHCNREDEMKAHLDSEHSYHDISSPLPDSWSKPYVQTKSGWECARCRESLGTWDARKGTIEAHWEECSRRVTAEIVKDFDVKECAGCEGLGTKTMMRQMGPNASRFQTLCLDCNGVGEVPRSRRPTFPV